MVITVQIKKKTFVFGVSSFSRYYLFFCFYYTITFYDLLHKFKYILTIGELEILHEGENFNLIHYSIILERSISYYYNNNNL
jgi:hypothetical protein